MEKEVLVDGKKIVYFEEGEGLPFLIIHGWGEFDAANSFLETQKLLAERGLRVFLPSLPGFIGSFPPLPGYKMKNYVEYAVQFLDKVEVKDFYLFGHSGGGALAIRLASEYPERVKALILCSPGIMGSGITPARLIQLCLFYSFVYGGRITKLVLSPMVLILKKFYRISNSHLRLENIVVWLRKHEKFYFKDKMFKIIMNIGKEEKTIPLLKKIKIPTLIIWGGKDFFNPLWACMEIGYLADHNLKVLPEVGHSPHKTCPRKLAELIKDFLSKLK